KTVPLAEAGEELRAAIDAQRLLYPEEHSQPVHPTGDGTSEIVASHSLIPAAPRHPFPTFGVLLSPTLPLARRQHELITTLIASWFNYINRVADALGVGRD